jgi:rsbT co-antagonist protein RsbR
MLARIASSQSKVFILDISGIAVVYTAVANYLIKMTKAAKLMGYLCIISGISGAVAQTIVELGINIDEIETCGSMYARCPENCPEYNKKTKYIKRVELCRLLS